MLFKGLRLFLLVGLLCYSCQSENDKLLSDLRDGMGNTGFNSLLDKKYLIVLPRTGCTGCISSIEEFLLSDSEKYHDQINVLLTDVISLKTARIKLGDDLISADYVFIDKGSDFYKGMLVSMYPLLIYLNSGEIEFVEEVSPQNTHALDNFYSSLSRD